MDLLDCLYRGKCNLFDHLLRQTIIEYINKRNNQDANVPQDFSIICDLKDLGYGDNMS